MFFAEYRILIQDKVKQEYNCSNEVQLYLNSEETAADIRALFADFRNQEASKVRLKNC
jgi:hypothetical protein